MDAMRSYDVARELRSINISGSPMLEKLAKAIEVTEGIKHPNVPLTLPGLEYSLVANQSVAEFVVSRAYQHVHERMFFFVKSPGKQDRSRRPFIRAW